MCFGPVQRLQSVRKIISDSLLDENDESLVFMPIWDCQTHVRMTSSVEWTDLDFKISVALEWNNRHVRHTMCRLEFHSYLIETKQINYQFLIEITLQFISNQCTLDVSIISGKPEVHPKHF